MLDVVDIIVEWKFIIQSFTSSYTYGIWCTL